MKALLLLDFQNDFDAFGPLAVPQAAAILAKAQTALQDPQYSLRIASQNWIPAKHPLFAANHYFRYPKQVVEIQGHPQHLWPMYGVQDSFGADWMQGFPVEACDALLQKGLDTKIAPYSCFSEGCNWDLNAYLQQQQITELVLGGFLTEFSVAQTALDALQMGYTVTILTELCGAANLEGMEAGILTLQELATAGVQLHS
jgi:nicotinamidase/pyrazinamidase